MSENKVDDWHIFQVINFIERSRYILIISIVTSLVISITFSIIAKNKYKASVLILPKVAEGAQPAISSPLQGLVGMNLSSGSDPMMRLLNQLESRDLFREFAKLDGVAEKVFDSKYDKVNKAWVGSKPTNEMIAEKLKKSIIQFRYDEKRSLIHISNESQDSLLTYFYVNKFVDIARSYTLQQNLREIKKKKQFIVNKLIQEKSINQKRTLMNLLQKEEEKEMLVSSEVFEIIENAVIPELPSSPNRVLIVIIGLILGLVAGSLISLVALTMQEYKRAQKHF
jgi:uncharacterized protein involved in exopolysaccharide biosynthesis